MKTTPHIRTILSATCLSAFLLSGCGDQSSDAAKSQDGSNSSSATSSEPAESAPPAVTESEHPLKEFKITGNDQMKFNIESIEAMAGQPLKVTFSNVGTMPKASMGHNWVLLKKDVDAAVFTEAGFASAGNDYINPDDNNKVLAKTPILGPGESHTVTFNAPSEAGEYTYVCTFPGHYIIGMKGVLVVE